MMKRLLWIAPVLLFSCAHGPRELEKRAKPRPRGAEAITSSYACEPLTDADRMRLLEAADPANFPATRYRAGADPEKGIEKETDCSRFVHEVYRRAGLPYSFRPTQSLKGAEEFDILPEKEASPGDLMLFRGHVGIVDNDGKIISALRTRHRRRKSSIESIGRKNFRSFRGQRYVLRYRCKPPEQEGRSLASESRSGIEQRTTFEQHEQ